MEDRTELVDKLWERIDLLKQTVALYEKRERLQEERHRMMIVKVENLRTDLRRALETLRKSEEIND